MVDHLAIAAVATSSVAARELAPMSSTKACADRRSAWCAFGELEARVLQREQRLAEHLALRN